MVAQGKRSPESMSNLPEVGSWVQPVGADPIGSLEVEEPQDVERLGEGSGTEGVEALTEFDAPTRLDARPGDQLLGN
jgi:hypothetical protein